MIIVETAMLLAAVRWLYMCFLGIVSMVMPEAVKGGRTLAGDPRALAVGICAHDEENVIFETVANVLDQGSSCYVMCDSCEDDTSAQVQLAGGVVLQGEYHSKGVGLLPLMARMRADGFERMAIIDADTRIGGDFCAEMSGALRDHPVVQGGLLSLNADTWVAGFMAVSTAVAQRFIEWGRSCLGMPGILCGTGWGIRSEILSRVPLISDTVCEDIEYTMKLLEAKVRVTYYPWAFVYNENVRSLLPLWRQMERWTRGSMQLVVRRWRGVLRHPELVFSILMFPFCICDVVLTGWVATHYIESFAISAGLWSIMGAVALAGRGELQKFRMMSAVGYPVILAVLVVAEVRGMLRYKSRKWLRTLHQGQFVEGDLRKS